MFPCLLLLPKSKIIASLTLAAVVVLGSTATVVCLKLNAEKTPDVPLIMPKLFPFLTMLSVKLNSP